MHRSFVVGIAALWVTAASAYGACAVTPASRYVSRSYGGGTSTLSVASTCQWSVTLNETWVRVVGPPTFTGNGTVSFQFDPLPFAQTDSAANGRSATFTIGDRTMTIYQTGWSSVGTDVNRDSKADLIWRNKWNGITWYQPMNGLTPGAGVTIADATNPAFTTDWRISTTRTATFGWEIYWKNFKTFEIRRQSMNGTSQFGSQFVLPPHFWHRREASKVAAAGQFARGTSEVLRWAGPVNLTDAFDGTDREIWREWNVDAWKIVGVDDFDGDQLLDILWYQSSRQLPAPGTLFMILEPGANKTSNIVHREPNLDWRPVATGDLTGDAKADVIWRNSADGRVWVQVMDGFRAIGSKVIWRDGNPDWQIQGVADFNADGRKDILWRNSATGLIYGMLIGENLTILGRGTVHHEPGRSWAIASPSTAEAVQRGNAVAGCGYNAKIMAPDQVYAYSKHPASVSTTAVPFPAQIRWYAGEGSVDNPTQPSIQFTAPRRPFSLVVNLGDGQTCTDLVFKPIDVIFPCSVTLKSRYIGVSYAGGRVTLDVDAASDCPWHVELPDKPDWLRVVGPADYTGTTSVTFEADPLPRTTGGLPNYEGRYARVFVGDKSITLWQSDWTSVGTDVVRDGKADIVWRNKVNGTTWVLPMNGLTKGSGFTVAAASAPKYTAEWRIATTTTDRSNWNIYWRNYNTHEAWQQTLNGTTEVTTPMYLAQLPANAQLFGAGRFEEYYDPGLAGRGSIYSWTSEHDYWVARPGHVTRIWTESNAAWKTVALDDFDGDLLKDMLWHNTQTGAVFLILRLNGWGQTGQVVRERPDLSWQIVAAGDVNGDAKADIVWRNTATGAMEVQAMDGFRTIGGGPLPAQPDATWKVQGMADFNGDGTKDLLWRRTTTGLVTAQLLNRNFTVLASGVVHNEPDLNWQIAAPATSERTQAGTVNP